MKTLKKNTKRQSWATHGGSLTQDDFHKSIKQAEKGLFFSVEEAKSMLEKWRQERNSQ